MREFFVYSTTHTTVGPAAIDQQTVIIDQDADFLASILAAHYATGYTEWSIQISDSSTGRLIFDSAQKVDNVCSIPGDVRPLPAELIMRKGSRFQVSATNGNATASTLQISFVGAKQK